MPGACYGKLTFAGDLLTLRRLMPASFCQQLACPAPHMPQSVPVLVLNCIVAGRMTTLVTKVVVQSAIAAKVGAFAISVNLADVADRCVIITQAFAVLCRSDYQTSLSLCL